MSHYKHRLATNYASLHKLRAQVGMISPDQIKVNIRSRCVSGASVLRIKALSPSELKAERKKTAWKGQRGLLNAIYTKRTFYVNYATAALIVRPHRIASKRSFAKWRRQCTFAQLFVPARPDLAYKRNGWLGWMAFLNNTT